MLEKVISKYFFSLASSTMLHLQINVSNVYDKIVLVLSFYRGENLKIRPGNLKILRKFDFTF